MHDPRNSATWLSDQVARELGATCRGLEAIDVVEAAHVLAKQHVPSHVAAALMQRGADGISARRIVEHLQALRDGRSPGQ